MHRCIFLVLILLCVFYMPGSVGWCLWLIFGIFSTHCYFKYFFFILSFCSFSILIIFILHHFKMRPSYCYSGFPPSPHHFLIGFPFWKSLLTFLVVHWFLYWLYIVNWILQRHSSFHSVFDFLHFFLSLRISIFLFTWPICSWILSTFSIKTFSILIRSILNSLYKNYRIYAISESGSDAYIVS